MKFGRKTQKNLFLEQDSLSGQDLEYHQETAKRTKQDLTDSKLIVCQRLEGKKVGETNSFSLDTKRSTKKASLTANSFLLQTLNIQLLMSTLS